MRNGLYKVSFQTQLGEGTGVVVLREGKVSGGDASMYYTGSYSVESGKFTASIVSAKHTDVPGVESVLGADRANIELKGSSTDTTASCQGSSPDAPGVDFKAELLYLSD